MALYGCSSGGGIDYSTTKKKVGTWIDGRPVYEQVYNVSYSLTEGRWNEISEVDCSNVDIILSCINITADGTNKLVCSAPKLSSTGSTKLHLYPEAPTPTATTIILRFVEKVTP